MVGDLERRAALGSATGGGAAIAKATGLSRQIVYRIQADQADAEAALETWEAREAKFA